MHPPEITGEPPDVWAALPVASRRKVQAEELEQDMARVLVHARGGVLHDAEVAENSVCCAVHEGILRRRTVQETPRSGIRGWISRAAPPPSC